MIAPDCRNATSSNGLPIQVTLFELCLPGVSLCDNLWAEAWIDGEKINEVYDGEGENY
jgi:hypothetical protein